MLTTNTYSPAEMVPKNGRVCYPSYQFPAASSLAGVPPHQRWWTSRFANPKKCYNMCCDRAV